MSSVLKNLSFTSSGCSGCASYKNYSSQHFFPQNFQSAFHKTSSWYEPQKMCRICYRDKCSRSSSWNVLGWSLVWWQSTLGRTWPVLGGASSLCFHLALVQVGYQLEVYHLPCQLNSLARVRGHLASLPQRFPESLLAVGAACDPACTKKGARATQVGGCASRCGEREKYATAPAACSCTHSAQPEHLVRGNMSRGGI